jgi:predicted N-formylglutamate amidohydrolase
MHSFTPVFKTVARLWHVGVLYNRNPRFAQILMELLHREEGLVVGDNEPYSVTDASDHTIPFHGERRNGSARCERACVEAKGEALAVVGVGSPLAKIIATCGRQRGRRF